MKSIYFIEIKVVICEYHLRYGCKNVVNIDFAMSLCASVFMCFVVTCWERADLLALVCGV